MRSMCAVWYGASIGIYNWLSHGQARLEPKGHQVKAKTKEGPPPHWGVTEAERARRHQRFNASAWASDDENSRVALFTRAALVLDIWVGNVQQQGHGPQARCLP